MSAIGLTDAQIFLSHLLPATKDARAVRALNGQKVGNCVTKIGKPEHGRPVTSRDQKHIRKRTRKRDEQVFIQRSLFPNRIDTLIPLNTDFLHLYSEADCGGYMAT